MEITSIVYRSKALKCNTNQDSEYRQAESHSNKNEEVHPKDSQVITHQFLCKHKNKEVKVTVEFPEQSDSQTDLEFTRRLKEIYLEKVKNGSMQGKESALPCSPDKSMEV